MPISTDLYTLSVTVSLTRYGIMDQSMLRRLLTAKSQALHIGWPPSGTTVGETYFHSA